MCPLSSTPVVTLTIGFTVSPVVNDNNANLISNSLKFLKILNKHYLLIMIHSISWYHINIIIYAFLMLYANNFNIWILLNFSFYHKKLYTILLNYVQIINIERLNFLIPMIIVIEWSSLSYNTPLIINTKLQNNFFFHLKI